MWQQKKKKIEPLLVINIHIWEKNLFRINVNKKQAQIAG